jgi:glucokinase
MPTGAMIMTDTILTVDLGGTLIRTARMNPAGKISACVREPIHAERGRDVTLPHVIDAIHRVAPTDGSRLKAIGISAPGPVDPWQGRVINLTNIPGWQNLPLVDILSSEFDCPVWLGNDGNVAALAEQRFGAAQGVKDIIYMTISTGIGGGIIIDDRLLLGARGLAAEVGHITIEVNGPRCPCGNIGCLEVLANGAAIARYAREAIQRGQKTAIADLAQGVLSRVTARLVNDAAQQGDPVAIELYRRAGFYVGVGIVNLMHVFNPAMFVIGGGVTHAGDLLFDPIKATVKERAMHDYQADVPIVSAALGDDVGLLGALSLVLSQMDGSVDLLT